MVFPPTIHQSDASIEVRKTLKFIYGSIDALVPWPLGERVCKGYNLYWQIGVEAFIYWTWRCHTYAILAGSKFI